MSTTLVSPARVHRHIAGPVHACVAALAAMPQAVCLFDADQALLYANPRFASLFGLSASTLQPGLPFGAAVARARRGSSLAAADLEFAAICIPALAARNRPASYLHALADGRILAVRFEPSAGGGWLLTCEDVTARRRTEARLAARMAHGAHHDALTGLPNRVLFHRRLLHALARGRRGEASAVLCLDLDHFKAVNDTLGHAVGDALLRAVTTRLQQQVRMIDTVCRLGGDEFAVLQSGPSQPPGSAPDTTVLAARIIQALSAPYTIEGHQVAIGVSIGIATVPGDGASADEVLRNADLALYRAKAEGRGRHRYFEPAMDASMQARRLLELELRKALAAGEFALFYQPQMDVQSRTVTGFEALLRWRHPTRGLLQPSDFVPFAEEIGFSVLLGEWTLRRACADAASWPGRYTVAVNLSAAQFGSPRLVEHVAAALDSSGLEPERVELEITETVMLKGAERTMTTLQGLRALGVGIAIDDFGTGLSSLNALRRFPFCRVKIDRSFIEQLGQGGDCDAIVAAVTELCRQLGLRTTAEGVETEGQFTHLQGGSCSGVQGYLFSRPTPAAEVPRLCQLLNGPMPAGQMPGSPSPHLAVTPRPPLLQPLLYETGQMEEPHDSDDPYDRRHDPEHQIVVIANEIPHARSVLVEGSRP